MSSAQSSTGATADQEAIVTFDEIRKVFTGLSNCQEKARLNLVPSFLSPDMQSMGNWLAQSYNKAGRKMMNVPKMALFYANNTFNDQDSSASIDEIPHFNRFLDDLAEGHSMLNHLCLSADCNLQLYELDSATPIQHSEGQPAMQVEEAAMALTYGMMSVEQQTDCLLASAFGQGFDRVAQNIITQMTATDRDVKGLDILRHYGSRELAALCGSVIAARLAAVPVILEGLSGLATLLILSDEAPDAISNCYWIQTAECTTFQIPAQWNNYIAGTKVKNITSAAAADTDDICPVETQGAEIIHAYGTLRYVSALLMEKAVASQ